MLSVLSLIHIYFHFLADVVNVLLQYLEGLSDAGRTDFQLIILILTVQLGLDVDVYKRQL